MRWSDIPFRPSDRTLRQFAGLWILFFGGFACWHGLVRERATLGAVAAALAISVGPIGLVWPRLIRPIFVGWMVVAFPIGWTVSRVILSVVYWGVFTPVALFFRAMGRDNLQLRPQPAHATYWLVKVPATEPASYFRQF